MERHREVKRGSSNMAANNGLTRRRPRNNNSLRDSPEEDGGMELQETSRLRDRGGVSKKDRDRINRNKRRRADRLSQHHHHHSNHNRGGGGDGGEDESSDDNNNNSLDDDDEDEDEEAGPGPVRMRPPTSNSTTTAANNNNPSSSSLSNHSNNNHHQLHHRKSFPPVTKVGRTTTPWKVSDEMGFSVPKKARSVSTKRSQSHECWPPGGGSTGGGSGELTHRQASTSPARPNSVAPPPPSSSMAPASPSSSSASIRKKMKPIGQKHRPPKVSSSNNNNNAMNNNNKPSSVQDDIEIEVAEVLYGLMRQSQCPTRQDVAANSSQKLDSRDTNGSNNDAKSRVSSPVSASPSSMASKLPQNSSSSNTPMSAVAPKRKRPRPTRVEEENSAVLANKKIEIEQSTKPDAKSERISGSAENFTGAGYDFGNSPPEIVQPELAKPESSNNTMMDAKNLMTEESMDQTKKVVVTSPKKESSSCAKVELDPENATATKATPTASVVESHREESFKFDLMEPPSKSSPERDSDMGFVSESKSVASDAEMKMESEGKGKDNVDMDCKKDIEEDVLLEKKRETMVEESDSHKSNAHVKHTMLDLDLEKHNKDCGPSTVRQQPPQIQQQHQSKNLRSEPKLEKAAPSTNSLPLPMNLAGWPAGLPPVGNGMPQVRPQGMAASLDGNSGSSNSVQPPGFLLSQPRPKRCATHYYVARNIYYHQQFTKMNPFWPAAAGPASLYGKQPYNLNVLPPTETAMIGNPLLGSFPGRNLNPVQEKSQADGAKDKSSVAANFMDSQPGKLVTKQMVLQQPPQQAAIHGPAFIFPMNQQQAAVVANNKAGAPKSSNNANATSSVATQSASGAAGNTSSMPAAAATTMSFNYPNMPGSEAQYVAILQNSGYPFPVPAHVGAQPTPFRGTPQAMPFFNGSFYSSQMMHPSQIQQQQQQQQLQQQLQQAQAQQVAVQQGHQNTSTSSGSSSSQKHHQQQNQQQSHQQRLQSGGGNAASGNSTSFNASKNRTQKPQNQSFPGGPQVRQHEADVSVEDSPSTEDGRVSQAHKNAYNHNFAMPIHQKNFASMSSAALTGGGSGNHSERQQHQQQQNIKGGPELVPNQAFAMPFASFNAGTAVSGLDFSSMAQNHVIFQSLPEAARHSYQQMAAAAAAAQAAQHKKTHQIQEEGKTVSDSNNADDERKMGIGKAPPSIGQAIVFSRPDSIDPSVTTLLGNSVVESSARTLNLISSPGNGSRSSRSGTSASAAGPTSGTGNTSNAQQHHQQQQHQHQVSQYMQLQKQQQQQMVAMHQQQQMQQQIAAAAAARGKPTTTSSSNVYPERHSSSSMAAKYPNAHYFPEVLAQGGSSTQSPQWKNTRTTASPVSSPSLASSTSSLKNLAQQQGRSQQSHTQISFGGNSKPGSGQHGQQIPTGNQSPSSPVVVGSPPTSVSKSAGGSPRASSTGSKVGSTPSLSSQQAKNTSSGPSRKSSPVGGRNAPSNLGNSHVNPAQCSTTKSQSHHQQQQQQQLHLQQQQQKQNLQQGQLLFTNMYMQAQSPQSTSNTSNTSGTPNIGYYQQRRQPAEQQQQQQPGSSNTVSSGMLTLSPSLTLAGATNDPTKAAQAAAAAAAAAANMKGGLPPPGLLQAAQYATQTGGHQFMSAAFPYLHSVPGVQVKPSEQKQPAGNDNLRASWQPEKR